MRVRGYAPLAAAACLLLPLTACNGGDKPSTMPTISPSTSQTETTPSVTTRPEDAAADLVQRAWLALDEYSQGTKELKATEGFFSPTCGQCSAILGALRKLREAGQHVEGGAHQVQVRSSVPKSSKVVQVQATISSRPGRLLDASGKAIRVAAGSPGYTWIFEVSSSGLSPLITSATNLGV